MLNPMPLLAPVMMATLFASENSADKSIIDFGFF
jgi:hypothetical protein